jgi:hypothetical protein
MARAGVPKTHAQPVAPQKHTRRVRPAHHCPGIQYSMGVSGREKRQTGSEEGNAARYFPRRPHVSVRQHLVASRHSMTRRERSVKGLFDRTFVSFGHAYLTTSGRNTPLV